MSENSNNFVALGFQNVPEVLIPVQLPIHGSLPSWLSGTLYRTGPGTYQVKTEKNKKGYHDVQHWFDGIGEL
jgi:torulene dioxygenase